VGSGASEGDLVLRRRSIRAGVATYDLGRMVLVWTLRVLLYAQLLLGFDRFSGSGGTITRELHLTFGFIVSLLALFVFRRREGTPDVPTRRAAQLLPLLPLALGLAFRFAGLHLLPGVGTLLVALHVILAFATVGVVEVTAGRQRRALLAAGSARS
jgi:hypothetical protein